MAWEESGGAVGSDAQVPEATYQDPGQEVGTAGPGFVAALANVLTHLASLAGRPQRVTRFHAIRAPQLSIHDYLMRISTYFQCSHECFVLGLVYIDRIVKLHPEFTICNLNIHRLLVTSVMLGAKFFDDVYYSNSYYAKVGGVRTQELNALEALFLRLIEWRLHVLPTEYEQYRNHVLTVVRGGHPGGSSQPGSIATPGASGSPDSPSAGISLAPYSGQPVPETPWTAPTGPGPGAPTQSAPVSRSPAALGEGAGAVGAPAASCVPRCDASEQGKDAKRPAAAPAA